MNTFAQQLKTHLCDRCQQQTLSGIAVAFFCDCGMFTSIHCLDLIAYLINRLDRCRSSGVENVASFSTFGG